MKRHRLNAHDVAIFRAAVRAEGARCLAAAQRMRVAVREDLARQFKARADELAELIALPRLAVVR